MSSINDDAVNCCNESALKTGEGLSAVNDEDCAESAVKIWKGVSDINNEDCAGVGTSDSDG
jgi:hypothetical protein